MALDKAKVNAIIIDKLGVEESQITPEASFTKDLGADSLDSVELVMEIESEFDVNFEEGEEEKIQTVGNVYDMLEAKLG